MTKVKVMHRKHGMTRSNEGFEIPRPYGHGTNSYKYSVTYEAYKFENVTLSNINIMTPAQQILLASVPTTFPCPITGRNYGSEKRVFLPRHWVVKLLDDKVGAGRWTYTKDFEKATLAEGVSFYFDTLAGCHILEHEVNKHLEGIFLHTTQRNRRNGAQRF